MCINTEETGTLPVARVLPSQTPILDRLGKKLYSFSATVTLPPGCIWDEGFEPAPYVETRNRMARLVFAQEVKRADGTKYNSYANVIAATDKAKKCALIKYTANGTFASVMNQCADMVDFTNNGNLTLREQLKVIVYPQQSSS